MDFLLSRYRNMTALLVVLLAQLVLVAWQVKSNEDVRLIRVWSVTAVTPLARVLEFVREHTIGAAQNYFVLVDVRNENLRLKDEVGRVKMENQFLRNELATAERMKALQAFQDRTPSRTLPARIIGTGTGTNSRVVFVDQGSSKGVMRGMAVVTPDGIVGKVLAAYPTASQVLLITDETFAAGVISAKNRVHGTVKGAGQSKVLVRYVQNEEKVDVGEMFYTSGDDRVFPKGMPVGRATVVRPDSEKGFKQIYLVPTALQQGLEEVLIVIEGVHGQIPDTATASASQNVYLMPPVETPQPAAPPATPAKDAATSAPGAAVSPVPGRSGALMTDADRLRERYKRIGEAQNHPYGQPSRPPNFSLNPDPPRPGAPTVSPQGAPRPQSAAPQTGAPRPQPVGGTPPLTARPTTTVYQAPAPAVDAPAAPAPQTVKPRPQPDAAAGPPSPQAAGPERLNRTSQPVQSTPVPSRTVAPRASEPRSASPQQ